MLFLDLPEEESKKDQSFTFAQGKREREKGGEDEGNLVGTSILLGISP